MSESLKRLLQGILVVVFLFVALNFNFFWQNLRYTFFRPKTNLPQEQSSATSTPNQINISSLGISAPIVYINKADEKTYQQALINGVVHFPGTANPGELGNCYIFGHSSDYFWSKGKYKTVFALLPRIEKGAEIVVTDQQGNKFSYIVTNTLIASPNDVKYFDQGNYQKKILTVQTSYPVGTALKRFLVIAELQKPTE